jgi:hypothetical protein
MKKGKKDKPYDDAFKHLAEKDAEALLLLLGEIEPGEQAEIVPLERELRISTRLPDKAYKVATASGERIVHIEALSRYPHVMPDRMADYGTREWMKYRLPVTCYVLLLTDRELPKDPVTFGRIDAGDVQIIVRYRLIRLSQISASQMLALQRENLLPFVPLMQGDRRELETGAERLRRVSDERHQLELGLHFLVLGALRYNPQDLLDLIGREDMIIPIPPEVYKESPAIEFLIDKSKDHWKEEGSVEALSETLRLLIASRFPNLKVSQKIKRIRNAALLQRLCVEVIKLPSAAAVRARLDEAIKSQDQ